MYIALADYTWYVETVNIPNNTPNDDIEALAMKKIEKRLKNQHIFNVSFYGIYSINVIGA